MPKPPFIPPESKHRDQRLAWLYYLEKTGNLAPNEEREIRELERDLFGTSCWDERNAKIARRGN